MADEGEGQSATVIAALVDNHRRFLAFLERRVRTRTEAEDILQAAFVRGIEKGGSIRDTDSAVAWFYRLLRNALVDHYRKTSTEARLFVDEPTEDHMAPEPQMHAEVCACIRRLLPALKPEYSEMIRRVDLEEEPLSRVADALGITANNATVRLHRARVELRKQLERSCGVCATHGCLDCDCGSPEQTARHS